MKKRFSLAAAALAVLALAACGSQEQTQSSAETAQETATVTETAVETEAAEVHYIDSLETQDFGGAAFRVYTTNDINGMDYVTLQNYAETETGEILNDTLYARDLWLEETYNVDMQYTIETRTDTSYMNSYISKIIKSGEDVYDLIIHDVAEIAKTQTTSGHAYPLNMVPGIDLTADYWFPELNSELWFGNNLYIAASVISPRFYGSAYVILFNRTLASTLDLDDMYVLVNDGKWTYDRMIANAKLAYTDLNGDGTMDDSDRFGIQWEILTPEALVLGADMHYVQNVDGTMTMMMDSEKLVSFMQTLKNDLHDSYAVYDDNRTAMQSIFGEGRYLYWNPCTFNLLDWRDVDYDYGVLPMPKYDESQAEYVTYAQPWVVGSPVVPITLTGDALSRAGTIINAMAAYGYDYVRPAVFENVIQLKGSRDEQSAQIIDKMFENVTFELTSIYGFGSFNSKFHTFFTGNSSSDVASVYEKMRKAVEKDIASVTDNYNSIAESIG